VWQNLLINLSMVFSVKFAEAGQFWKDEQVRRALRQFRQPPDRPLP